MTDRKKQVTIGMAIKSARVAQGWTQKVLSDKLGWGQFGSRKISKIESGFQNIPEDELEMFAKVFGMRVEELCSFDMTGEGFLEGMMFSEVDLRNFLKKIAELKDPVSFSKLVSLLRSYLSLRKQGLEL